VGVPYNVSNVLVICAYARVHACASVFWSMSLWVRRCL